MSAPYNAQVDAFRDWSPAGQALALERLKNVGGEGWRPFFCKTPGRLCDGRPHEGLPYNHARADQWPPPDSDWTVWLMQSGRGAGKTRTGAEFTTQMTHRTGRIAIVAATRADARDVMVEGPSGLIAVAPPGNRPHYEPSKRRVTWPNECVATLFSAEDPDRLRGPEHGYAWIDEAAHYSNVQEVWDNLMLGLRIGAWPRVVITTTPKPRPWLSTLIGESMTRVTRASTYDNLENLAPAFAAAVLARYEGTRLGRQELHGELLTDVEGALWSWELIEVGRVGPATPGDWPRVVVGVDPAGANRATADETGIIVAAASAEGHYYVLDDRSGRYSPHGWAQAVDRAASDWSADAVIAETNYGGEMVTSQLRLAGYRYRLITVHARIAKALRAEPVVGLYEQHLVHHCGRFEALEEQMCGYVPYERGDSPDRLDALVYALTALAMRPGRAHIASPVQLRVETPSIGPGTEWVRERIARRR